MGMKNMREKLKYILTDSAETDCYDVVRGVFLSVVGFGCDFESERGSVSERIDDTVNRTTAETRYELRRRSIHHTSRRYMRTPYTEVLGFGRFHGRVKVSGLRFTRGPTTGNLNKPQIRPSTLKPHGRILHCTCFGLVLGVFVFVGFRGHGD